MKLYGIVGAGGFGREVIPLAKMMLAQHLKSKAYQLVFIEEHTPRIDSVNQYPVMSLMEFIAHPAQEKYFNIAIGSHHVRKRLAESILAQGLEQGIQAFSIAAFNSVQLEANEIAMGGIFCPFSMVTANAKIGKFFHANIYSYVAHDCIIGDYVTFAPGVKCNGSVVIEDEAYIGTGAIIKQGTPGKPIVIGRGAVIGMGAVVTKSVAAYTTVIGNPARLLEAKKSVINFEMQNIKH